MGTEAEEGRALCQYIQLKHPRVWDHLLHIPNGMRSNPRSVSYLKAQGLKPGIPDYFLALPRGRYHGLWLELKAGKGKPSADQKEWLGRLAKQDYACVVAWGWEAAAQCIEHYLAGQVDEIIIKDLVEQ